MEESRRGGGRRISRKRKGNMLNLCAKLSIHECTRDDGTNRETTGEGPDLPKNNLVRIIMGVKRADNRTCIK